MRWRPALLLLAFRALPPIRYPGRQALRQGAPPMDASRPIQDKSTKTATSLFWTSHPVHAFCFYLLNPSIELSSWCWKRSLWAKLASMSQTNQSFLLKTLLFQLQECGFWMHAVAQNCSICVSWTILFVFVGIWAQSSGDVVSVYSKRRAGAPQDTRH